MTLALKLVLTPALIGSATLVGRRFGPSISGWLVGLPFTSGPVSLFLALEQGTPFAAAAAAGSIGGVAASAVFAVAYAAMARRSSVFDLSRRQANWMKRRSPRDGTSPRA